MIERPSPGGVGIAWRALDPVPMPIRRLLVLLPNADLNEALLARALWTLAGEHQASVRIVALVDDWADENLVNTRVALLVAFLRSAGIESAELYERDSTDWLGIVRRLYRPGDVIVCHAEQLLPAINGSALARLAPLSTYIAMLHLPVCELRGAIKRPPAMTVRHAMRVWLLPLIIISISLALEVVFIRWARNWADVSRQAVLAIYTALEILTVVWLAKQ